MAARGYEFYFQVLKVSLPSERSERVKDTFNPEKIKFVSRSGQVIYWSSIAKCLSQKCFETRI